jgi:hypothetical protein
MQRLAKRITAALRSRLDEDVAVERIESSVRVSAFKNEQIEQARRIVDQVFIEANWWGAATVYHRDTHGQNWTATSPQHLVPRAKHRGQALPPLDPPLLSTRAKRITLAGVTILAAAGATYYALAPGVASYQIGFVLMLPMLATIFAWLHKRLPSRIRWTLAIALAAVGPAGYLIFGGAQWWAWGQFAVLPLVLLVAARGVSRSAGVDQQEFAFHDHIEGPWGPP